MAYVAILVRLIRIPSLASLDIPLPDAYTGPPGRFVLGM